MTGSARATERASKYKSGYEDASKFGGPSSVGAVLQKADEVSEPRIRFPLTDRVYKPWFDFKAHINRKLGMSFSLDYQALYQVVNESPGEEEAAAGLFRFYGT